MMLEEDIVDRLHVLDAAMFFVALALGSSVVCAQVQPHGAHKQLAWMPVTAPRWICSPDPHGDWNKKGCPGPECKAHCVELSHCDPGSVSITINACASDDSCTPLVLHRRLGQRGCGFNADSFWTGANARPLPVTSLAAADALRRYPLKAPLEWAQPSCRESDKKGIRRELDVVSYRGSTTGRSRAYAALIARGCNVDLARMGPDGNYKTDVSGTAAQPPLTVTFTGSLSNSPTAICHEPGERSVCMPMTTLPMLTDAPVCKALSLLYAARRFALCAVDEHGADVSVRFLHRSVDQDKITERIEIVAASGKTALPPEVGTPPTSTTLRSSSPDTTSPRSTPLLPVAAGSAGVGVLLAGLAKGLFSRYKKKDDGSDADAVATHVSQDVHVTAGFREPPKLRISKADPTPPPTRERS